MRLRIANTRISGSNKISPQNSLCPPPSEGQPVCSHFRVYWDTKSVCSPATACHKFLELTLRSSDVCRAGCLVPSLSSWVVAAARHTDRTAERFSGTARHPRHTCSAATCGFSPKLAFLPCGFTWLRWWVSAVAECHTNIWLPCSRYLASSK